MKTTETKARAGEGVSGAPAEEVKSALQGFLSEFKGFQDDMTSRLQQQEERLTMLDRKSFTAGRPALSTAVDLDAPHKKAFGAYLRSGDDDGLRGLVLEGKALNTQVNAEGGFLVALAEACLLGGRGATLTAPSADIPEAILFGEDACGFIVSGTREALERLGEKIPLDVFGTVGGDALQLLPEIEGRASWSLDELREAHGALALLFP